MYAIMFSHFPNLLLFCFCSFFESFKLFVLSTFQLCSLGCHICPQNCFLSLSSACWYVFSSLLLVDIFFCDFGMPCFVYIFTQSQYLSSFSSLASIFWFISLGCIVCFSCVVFFFMSQHIPSFFLILINWIS